MTGSYYYSFSFLSFRASCGPSRTVADAVTVFDAVNVADVVAGTADDAITLDAADHASATANATVATAVNVADVVADTTDAAGDLDADDHASVTAGAILGIDAAAHASATAAATVATDVNVTDDDAGPADAVIDLAPEVMSIELSSGDPLCSRFDEYIPIVGSHILAGLDVQYADVRARLQLLSIDKRTPAACIPRWCSRLRHACILGVDNVDICTLADLTQAISVLRSNGTLTCYLRLTFEDMKNTLSASGLPQLYFEQLRGIRRVTQQRRSDQPKAHHLTRTGLHVQPDWNEWVSSAEEQLDACDWSRQKTERFGWHCSTNCRTSEVDSGSQSKG